jgi:hypothetical protein
MYCRDAAGARNGHRRPEKTDVSEAPRGFLGQIPLFGENLRQIGRAGPINAAYRP